MIEALIKILESWEIDFQALMAKLILGSTVLLIFYILGKVLKHIAYRINSKILSKHPDWQKVLSVIIYYFFLFTGYILFLKILGLEQYLTKLLAGAGIIGIIAGFALKDIASNAFSGLLLFFEKPFKTGDWVQVDGHYGKILKVGILTTELLNRTGQQVFISNQLIYSGAFINYSKFDVRGIQIQADVIQFFDLEQLKKILVEEVSKNNAIDISKKINFYVTSIAQDGNFSFELYYWVHFDNDENFKQIVSEALAGIKQVSIDNKIDIVNAQWVSDEDDTTSAEAYGNDG